MSLPARKLDSVLGNKSGLLWITLFLQYVPLKFAFVRSVWYARRRLPVRRGHLVLPGPGAVGRLLPGLGEGRMEGDKGTPA